MKKELLARKLSLGSGLNTTELNGVSRAQKQPEAAKISDVETTKDEFVLAIQALSTQIEHLGHHYLTGVAQRANTLQSQEQARSIEAVFFFFFPSDMIKAAWTSKIYKPAKNSVECKRLDAKDRENAEALKMHAGHFTRGLIDFISKEVGCFLDEEQSPHHEVERLLATNLHLSFELILNQLFQPPGYRYMIRRQLALRQKRLYQLTDDRSKYPEHLATCWIP